MMDRGLKTLRILGLFLLHMIFGTLLFIAIAGTALGLHLFREELAGHGFPVEYILALRGIEYLVFAGDGLLYLLFFVRECWKLAREIWEATR